MIKDNLFTKLDEVDDADIHPKFKLLQDPLTFQGEQIILQNWVDGFIDRDGKILKEFQTTFHSTFWEFYLFAVFKEMGLNIDFSKSRPDFVVTGPTQFLVEAVVAQIKKGGESEGTRNLDHILDNIEPLHRDPKFYEIIDEAICRHSNSIQTKTKKYEKYIQCNWVDENSPYVIALGSYDQIAYGRESHYSLLALLYGHYFNPESNELEKKSEITKPGGNATIPIDIFSNTEFENVSAVIFSCTITIGKLTSLSKSQQCSILDTNYVFNIRHDTDYPHYKVQEVSESNPEELTDGLFIFHNPNAKNKLPFELFNTTNALQVVQTDAGLFFHGQNCPIVSRLNLPKAFLPDMVKNALFAEIHQKYNT